MASLREKLFGVQNITPLQQEAQTPIFQEYLDTLGEQPYMQSLLNSPKETGLTLDQYKEGFKQGLNFGVPELAQKQKEFNINIPKTGEEIELAKLGEFNKYNTGNNNDLSGGLIAEPVQGGFFNDFQKGYRENYNNKFSFDNLYPEKKGFATRLGEGLGTVGRFVDSPLGRGLIAAGLNSALGYDNSLQEGLTAYVGRQNAQTTDNIYRNQLKQMGFSDDDLAQIKGNLTSDIYKNLIQNMYKFRNLDQNTYMKMKTAYDRQLQQGIVSPEEYKANIEALNNQYINSQIQTMQAGNVGISNQTRNADINEKLLPYKEYAFTVTPQVALGNLVVAQRNLGLNSQRLQHQIEQDNFDNWLKAENLKKGTDGRGLTTGAAENLSGTYQGIKQMNDLKGIINTLPNRITTPGIAQLSSFNPLDTDAQAFNQYVKTYKQVIGKGLEGGVLRKEDEAKYDQIIPKLGDTKAVLHKKAEQLQNMLINKYSTDLDFYRRAGYNTNNFEQSGTSQNNTQAAINRLKQAGYSDEKIQQYLQAKGLL